ncbi:Coiled-coil domain containing 9 [Chamberlinius hualienensis]
MQSEEIDEAALKAEKEMKLNARMEQIRLRNAQLQKRHEEVKADKQNAEAASDEFHEKHRLTKADQSTPKPNKIDRISVKSRLGPSSAERPPQRQPRSTAAVFKPKADDENGPPPDPKYSFLSDRSRENRNNDEIEKPRNENSRRHPSNYGPPRNKMEMSLSMTGRERREYEAWRKERSEIESARLNRQKTSSGQWRREWDVDKNAGSEEYDSRGFRSYRESWDHSQRDNYHSERFQSSQEQKPNQDLRMKLNRSSQNEDLRIKLDSMSQNRKVTMSNVSNEETRDSEFRNPATKATPIYKEKKIDSGLSLSKQEVKSDNVSEAAVASASEATNVATEKFENSDEDHESWDDEGSWEEESDGCDDVDDDDEKNKVDNEESFQDKSNLQVKPHEETHDEQEKHEVEDNKQSENEPLVEVEHETVNSIEGNNYIKQQDVAAET